ncbi:unnamed protein product [Didymodactylos carnosus]|uniref:Glycosyltransferase family 28 N-terminal domain-containing protein n=1 Tax=Didymodactylos carnosus TaxID=1234261 RepID=A0A814V5L3_9BILA|nr:unnamed protein product [Didymodactylos carnosus]CAF1182867.1 unnamed protein product [Didymodactylos carnosus]CAF3878636.1 unnamed protein product [Didymodactylos carnosus]CAF3947260.1 unnamed protein product [Didymodactylos carnosus]
MDNLQNLEQETLIIDFNNDWECKQFSKQSTIDPLLAISNNIQPWEPSNFPNSLSINASLYRKHFTLNEEWKGKQFYLKLDGIMAKLSVNIWLNEKQIVYRGYTPSLINIGDTIHFDIDNVITIYLNGTRNLSRKGKHEAQQMSVNFIVTNINSITQLYDRLTVNSHDRNESLKLLDYATNVTNEGRIDIVLEDDDIWGSFSEDFSFEFKDQNETILYGKDLQDKDRLTLGQYIPHIAICILVVGSRGDVQPFVALGQELLKAGHRVRLATHEIFRQFVKENGLEFFPLAGDPAELMTFMVKNAGLIPSVSSIMAGDIEKKRKLVAEIMESTWRACIQPDEDSLLPFTAEAIISNPPTFGHIHCAQKLSIPLHIFFTMPWSPTGAFPHPLCNVDYRKAPAATINYMSYGAVEMLTWTGMKDLINNFRKKTLQLESLSTSKALHLMESEKVPHTYCWSPSLIGKPKDWGNHIDVSGFFFLDLATNFTPPDDLVRFLNAGAPPIYIGFGSITGDDPVRLTNTVLEAVKLAGCRAIISKGWGGIGDGIELPENIYLIGNCPHDWLFQHVAAVCHHGGAGTTAAGLRLGKPTIVVPFFGDQFFWGAMIHKIGAGPAPQHGKNLKASKLADAFRLALEPETQQAAQRLSEQMKKENGVAAAVRSFHTQLPLDKMISDLEPSFPASFYLPDYDLKISLQVAQVLAAATAIQESELRVYHVKTWEIRDDQGHLPSYGIYKHGTKAFSSLLVESVDGFKKAWNAKDLITGSTEAGKGLAKGVGKSLFHTSVGIFCLYGEVTDTLSKLPSLYDPYHISRPRPVVTDIMSGAKAGGLAAWHGLKDGVQDLYKKPLTGAKKHGPFGFTAGVVVGLVNAGYKPAVGTLSSLTWIGRGIYMSSKEAIKGKKAELVSLSTVSRSQNSSREDLSSIDKLDDSLEGLAAVRSGYTKEVCRTILQKFEQIKLRKKLQTPIRSSVEYQHKQNRSPESTIRNVRPKRSRSYAPSTGNTG